MKDIPGISVKSYPLSEASIRCQFTMSYSDAKDLFNKTQTGLPANRRFREWFLDKLAESVTLTIQEKGK